ncbi:5'-nucleotidase SurE [Iodidimonas gelatinilytica]|uniref:5'-nucleotidase SurE n=2 Tax=Iodidimonas TaxID=2066486 RepID=A0A5A7MS40_9PROT|nr:MULTISPECIES: 5'/3'-nucleotidase SurE [Iodidimonas]GEQ98790.1 5'-nucleotidase SurE [Iodidimonas gelatinilytica]GER01326.1 5'-nucleotidase SurE [Iodidimonas gelatinilytica]GER06329.1 5'-nucleotidase SurE [Kordiimonadales bacterium JCM 17843]GGO04340.1 5'-nucleotidase SurE [Iodidimonas muriae]
MSRPISTKRILVSNDDGIHATGIRYLEAIARELSDDVWVVAPDSEQSGAGHSLTLTEPLRLRQVDEKRFAVRGTPTDSVMLAVNHIMKDQRPTLVLSGINRGANLAEDVTYSGTVAAAMEGTLAGIPSIALSQAVKPAPVLTNWSAAKAYAKSMIEKVVAQGWPVETLININFPSVDADLVKGVRVTKQGQRDLGQLNVEQRTDMRGVPYYWFRLSREPGRPAQETDLKMVREGWISITPLHLNLTHSKTRDALAKPLDETF